MQNNVSVFRLFFQVVPSSFIDQHLIIKTKLTIDEEGKISVDSGDFFSRFVLSFLTTPQSCPLGSEFSGATEIHYYLQSRKSYFGGNYSVLYYVACPSVYCSSAVLSRLLDTIAKNSNDKLI